MPLRHSKKPAPGWLAACAGPFLVFFGLLAVSFAAFVQSKTSPLNAAVTIAVCLLLIWLGIQLIRDYTWPSIKSAFGARRDTDRD